MLPKLIFAVILSIHGVIHLLGFVKEWRLAEARTIEDEAGPSRSVLISRLISILWLGTCLLFLFAAAVLMLQKHWWWQVTILAVLFSQILVVIYWPDAKYGSIINVIIFMVAGFAFAEDRFNQRIQQDIREIFAGSPGAGAVKVTPGKLRRLPQSVRNWLQNSGITDIEPIRNVHLCQQGQLRTSREGRWMPVQAKQYINVKDPAFVWQARIRAAPLVTIHGRDKYHRGRGNMLIKIMSLFTVADSRGPETDQGSLLRFLGEMVWYPSFALSTAIDWLELDSTSAQATMHHGEITASGIFHFTGEGDVAAFEADRYYDRNGRFTLERWFVTVDDYADFAGIRMPTRAQVSWKLAEGEFTWYSFEVTHVEYNSFSGFH